MFSAHSQRIWTPYRGRRVCWSRRLLHGPTPTVLRRTPSKFHSSCQALVSRTVTRNHVVPTHRSGTTTYGENCRTYRAVAPRKLAKGVHLSQTSTCSRWIVDDRTKALPTEIFCAGWQSSEINQGLEAINRPDRAQYVSTHGHATHVWLRINTPETNFIMHGRMQSSD